MAYVIKSNQEAPNSSATPHQATPRRPQWEDWSQRAQSMLERVRHEAREILEAARDEAKRIRETARREGLQAGRDAARQAAIDAAQRELATLMPAMQQFQQQLQQSRSSFQRAWEVELIRLAVSIAERIVRREVTSHPEVTAEWIREAIELATRGDRITVRLHPQDLTALQPHVESIRQQLGEQQLEVVGDPEVDAGTCLVVTPSGTIDYRIPAQMERVLEELTW